MTDSRNRQVQVVGRTDNVRFVAAAISKSHPDLGEQPTYRAAMPWEGYQSDSSEEPFEGEEMQIGMVLDRVLAEFAGDQ